MKKKLHCLKVFKHAFARINKSKVLTLFLISLGIPLFAQYQKLDPNFEILLKEKDNIAKGRKIKLPENGITKIEPKIVVTKNGPKTMYPAFVYTDNPSILKEKGIIVETVLDKFATTLLSIEDIENLRNDPTIISIMAPYEDQLANSVSIDQSGAGLLHNGVLNNTKYDGEGILVGIFDTGIDYTHPDFRDPDDPTKSRIVSIWDQSITAQGTETPPLGFTTGVEYTRAQIEDEIDGTPANFVRQKDTNGHGTHVAGTVAGNGAGTPDKRHKGFAPKAELVVVKGTNAAGTFPSINTVNSLTYFQNVATAIGKPIVLNYSIGGQGTAKDGTAEHEITMDKFSNSGPGRVVVVAAGNDWGGNFHKQAEIQPNDVASFEIKTTGTTTTNNSIFSFYIYADNNNDLVATLTDPNGLEVEFPVSATTTNDILSGAFKATGYNYYNPATNNKRYIQIITQRVAGSTVNSAGTYTIKVKNVSSTPTIVHGYKVGANPTNTTVTLTGGDNKYITSSPGNSTEAITVANYNGRERWYSSYDNNNYSVSSSSQGYEGIVNSSNEGPRLDGVLKPEIAASGSMVVSSRSSDANIPTNELPYIADNSYYIAMNGTSMASPGVAGATALLLQANPNLNSREVKELLTTSAFKDIATGNTANTRWGHGKLNIYEAVSKTLLPIKSDTETLALDDKLVSRLYTSLPNRSFGNVLTPTKSGKLGSISIMTRHSSSGNTLISNTPLTVEIRNVINGLPGDILATKVIYSPTTEMQLGSWHTFDVSDFNIQTTYGEEIAVTFKSSGNFYMLVENTNVSNKSFILTDNVWTPRSSDLVIRATVYEDIPAVKVLATANRETSLAIVNNKNYFVKDWENLGRIEKNEGHTIEGEVKAKVWLTNSTQHVNRVYEYTPVNNPSTSSAKVTLYYSQSDFDNFNENKAPGLVKNLPSSPTDENGKSNLVLYKYNGTSSDNSGNIKSYTQGFTTIPLTTSNILWNPTYSFWEISFETTGFSGFILGTDESLSTANSKHNELLVYPNPVKENLNINLPQGESKGQATFYDMTGKVIKTVSLNNTNNLNVSSLAKGVYLVEITTSKGVKETKKIVKQ